MKRLALLAVSMLAGGCGGKAHPPGPYISGFNPSDAQPGFTRFVTPIIPAIQPGDSPLYCQWIQAPLDHDMDVLVVTGQQSKWGHHVVLYANTMSEPVGTSRLCANNDMLSVRYLGAIGGEGAAIATMPAGVVLRLPAGQAIMANVHFINASQQPIEGQSVMDVQFAAPDPSRTVAGFFTNLNTAFDIPANTAGTAEARCTAQKDMQFFLFADHMHSLGRSIFTENVRADGTTAPIVRDDIWQPEFTFNPTFASWSLTNAMHVKAGDTIHTHCEWDNTSTHDAVFPVEMCVSFGFFVPALANDVICSDGSWSE